MNEDDAKAEIRKIEEMIAREKAATGTWVKVHTVWIAGLLGILFGFILGKVT